MFIKIFLNIKYEKCINVLWLKNGVVYIYNRDVQSYKEEYNYVVCRIMDVIYQCNIGGNEIDIER